MAELGHLVVVTPWYPSPGRPYWGAFVRESVAALRPHAAAVRVVHVVTGAGGEQIREVVDDVDVLRVPVEVPSGAPRADVAEAVRDALAGIRDELLADAVHVHVGLPTGWAVVDLVGRDVPVVVTEHASYLNQVFADPRSALQYAAMVAGARSTTAVSAATARALRHRFPGRATDISTVGNPVAIDRLELREHRVHRLDRWLYVGNLLEAKGILRVVDAFAAWRAERPGATLTVAGDGVDGQRMRALAERHGVADALTMLGPVEPGAVGDLARAADLLVHLSASETFGLTAVEAVLCGTPVVATQTAGAAETLDVAQDLRMAWLVALPGEVDAVLLAVRGQEARLAAAQPELARADLVRRYSPEAVGAHLARVLVGGSDAPRELAPLFVGIAMHSAAVRHVTRTASDAARAGWRAVIVADRERDLQGLDERVDVVEIGSLRKAMPTHRLERLALSAGAPTAVKRWGERLVHAHLDPIHLARRVLRGGELDLTGVRLVVWGTPHGLPLGARILRDHARAEGFARLTHAEALRRLGEWTPGEP